MKTFNLKEAMEGKPICDRKGRKCTFVAYSPWEGRKPVIVRDYEGLIVNLNIDGSYALRHEQPCDLFMADPPKVKKEGWINMWEDHAIYESREAALSGRRSADTMIVKIKWEESE